jgi:flagellar biosynthetic protein FliQ
VDASSLAQWAVDALHVTLLLASPAVLAGLAVGVCVGFFQSATQASDPSLGFVPKLFVVGAVLLASRELMSHELLRLSAAMLHDITAIAR